MPDRSTIGRGLTHRTGRACANQAALDIFTGVDGRYSAVYSKEVKMKKWVKKIWTDENVLTLIVVIQITILFVLIWR